MRTLKGWKALLLLAIVVLLGLHWVHLGADPSSRVALLFGKYYSTDLYADEGLDSSGAIAAVRYGHWYLPGQFNLAVDAPLWSGILLGAFHFTGLNLVVARSLEVGFFALSILLLYLFMREWLPGNDRIALWSALILSSNYLAFSFSRMAILESVWTFFVLAALLLGTRACRRSSFFLAYVAGLCFACACMTKLTAAFVALPLCAVYYFSRERTDRSFRLLITTLVGSATLVIPYALIVLLRFRTDHDYYRQVNVIDRAVHGLLQWAQSVIWIVKSIRYYDLPLCLAFVAGAILAVRYRRHLRTDPLIAILALWLLGDFFVSSPVAYFPPRYLLNPLFPFSALAVCLSDAVLRRSPAAGRALYCLLALAALLGTGEIVAYLARPAYTLQAAADSITAATPGTTPKLMGDFAYTMALYADINPVDDGFGVNPRPQRIAAEQPQLYLTLGSVSPDRAADFRTAGQRLVFLRAYNALDNYVQGMPLYLYRVLPIT